ncbi:MAG: ribonuclease HI family protein [Candidatus Dojkabacteria bacterium]
MFDESKETKNFLIYSDGGSRGNPGNAAYGWLLFSVIGLESFDAKYIGIASNNSAEYQGIYNAIKAFKTYVSKEKNIETSILTCYLDSELIVKQLLGEYKVKDQGLKIWYKKIIKLQNELKDSGIATKFVHVRREKNKHADRLVNICLDIIELQNEKN